MFSITNSFYRPYSTTTLVSRWEIRPTNQSHTHCHCRQSIYHQLIFTTINSIFILRQNMHKISKTNDPNRWNPIKINSCVKVPQWWAIAKIFHPRRLLLLHWHSAVLTPAVSEIPRASHATTGNHDVHASLIAAAMHYIQKQQANFKKTVMAKTCPKSSSGHYIEQPSCMALNTTAIVLGFVQC